MEKDRLDLHALFEAGGNEPVHRMEVLDAIVNLTREGMIEASGGDFYALTERGKQAISR
jgi:predicted transcriptional regulator